MIPATMIAVEVPAAINERPSNKPSRPNPRFTSKYSGPPDDEYYLYWSTGFSNRMRQPAVRLGNEPYAWPAGFGSMRADGSPFQMTSTPHFGQPSESAKLGFFISSGGRYP